MTRIFVRISTIGLTLLCISAPLFAQSREQGLGLLNEAKALRERARSSVDLEAALIKYRQAAAVFRGTDDHQTLGVVLNIMGNVHHALGQYQNALEMYEQSIIIKRNRGDAAGEAATLYNSGAAYLSLTQYQNALGMYEQSLAIMRRLGNAAGEAANLALRVSAYQR